jgi:hypothetical protein
MGNPRNQQFNVLTLGSCFLKAGIEKQERRMRTIEWRGEMGKGKTLKAEIGKPRAARRVSWIVLK